jgi:hypothetical protein
MERAVNVLGDCGEALRTHSVRAGRLSNSWSARAVAFTAVLALRVLIPATTSAQTSAPASADRRLVSSGSQAAPRPAAPSASSNRPKVTEQPPPSPVPAASLTAALDAETISAPRFKVRDMFGQCVVARLHGQHGDKTGLILPDGQLGTSNLLVPTDEPFQPLNSGELEALLHGNKGPYTDYQLLKTDHYLIFYKSTRAFAEDSGRLLEDLYRGLIDAFQRHDVPVHESEFPLVAVIFATEADFRAHKDVDRQVRAYYEYYTNRIFFFQKSERDAVEPKIAALLKPQTVAHEGAHQILSNIGVQPRPSNWPLWLVEGLAEYCATTSITKKGIMWSGLGAINSLHMATIRELEDPLNAKKIARKESISPSETLLLKSSLSPTDYALAWALTHYLAQKRLSEFVRYLNAMSQIPPLEPRTPAENLAEFRKYFNEAPAKLDKRLSDHIHRTSKKGTYDSLYYYAVVFEQPLANGLLRRAATFSQSPQIIQEWVQEMTSATGGFPSWEATAWPTRAAAEKAVEDWIRGN